MSLELFVRGLHTRTAVARHPCFSWAFLFIYLTVYLFTRPWPRPCEIGLDLVECSFGLGLDHEALTSASRFRPHLTLRFPLLPYGYGYTVEHPLQDRVKPSFVIFDIRGLWRSGLSVRVP